MDIASLAGILLALFMLVFGIISSAGVGGFREYLDPASAIITFGGAFSCTLMSMSLQNYIAGLKSFTLIFKARIFTHYPITLYAQRLIVFTGIQGTGTEYFRDDRQDHRAFQCGT